MILNTHLLSILSLCLHRVCLFFLTKSTASLLIFVSKKIVDTCRTALLHCRCVGLAPSDEAFDTLRTRPEFAVFIFDAEANVLCEGRPLAEIVRYAVCSRVAIRRTETIIAPNMVTTLSCFRPRTKRRQLSGQVSTRFFVIFQRTNL
jgi:hypothetical protein